MCEQFVDGPTYKQHEDELTGNASLVQEQFDILTSKLSTREVIYR
jgi:hypothetical protein